MDKERVARMLAAGQTPRQIARQTGYPRTEIESVARNLARNRRRALGKRATTAVLILSVVGVSLYAAYRIYREPTQEEFNTAILKAADSLPAAAQGPSWFIENDVATTEPAVADVGISDKIAARVKLALQRNAAIPQVNQLRLMFAENIVPTVFTGAFGGASRMTRPNNRRQELDVTKDPKMMEVVLYGRFAYTHPKIGRRLLFYDPEWRAFFMAALNFADETWFDGIVAHELWHAKMHREGAPSAFQAMYTDLWVSEELDAHGLERDVLDLQTQGQYKRLLAEVAASKRAGSTRKFLVQVTPEDLVRLNGLFRPGLPEEQDQRAAQYLLDLSLAWLAGRHSGQELRGKQIEAYRLLVSPQSTNVKVG